MNQSQKRIGTFAWIERNKRRLIAAAIITASSTAALGGPNLNAENKAKEYIANLLKDPEGAKFINVKRSKEKDSFICGEVNGKNAYGGYVGYQKFYYLDAGRNFSSGEIMPQQPSVNELNFYESQCGK